MNDVQVILVSLITIYELQPGKEVDKMQVRHLVLLFGILNLLKYADT